MLQNKNDWGKKVSNGLKFLDSSTSKIPISIDVVFVLDNLVFVREISNAFEEMQSTLRCHHLAHLEEIQSWSVDIKYWFTQN